MTSPASKPNLRNLYFGLVFFLILGFSLGPFHTTAHAATANELNLVVEHDITDLGADGVTRRIQFQERVYRRSNLVWIERILPPAAHDAAEHAAAGQPHKHLDLSAAARWIVADPKKNLSVRLVNEHDQVVINVPPAEYGNIGFDGSWVNAWHLLDPAQLKNMKPGAAKTEVGKRWYARSVDGNAVRVLWDELNEIPRRVESVNKAGTQRKLLTVRDVAAPAKSPWMLTGSYQQKEYSDYLD